MLILITIILQRFIFRRLYVCLCSAVVYQELFNTFNYSVKQAHADDHKHVRGVVGYLRFMFGGALRLSDLPYCIGDIKVAF